MTQTTILHPIQLHTNGGTQSRAELNEAKVQEYTEAMKNGDQFPALDAIYDGRLYYLWDGFHRLEAHARAFGAEKRIQVNIQQGTQRDAILHSAGANATHGLPRSNDDKRRAVTRLLQDEEWGQWSDNEIARRCHVSQPFVSKLRGSLVESGEIITNNVISDERTYITKHGAEATMNTANIGRKPAPSDTAETVQVVPGEQQPQIREKLKAWISQSNASYDSIVRRLADKEASGHQYMMDMAAEALNTDGMFIWHAAMTLRNQLPEKIICTPIHQLQNLLHLWLVYATGSRDITIHREWLADLKAQGNNGEYFNDTQDWMESRATYRKNDLWQACQNYHDDLTQQLTPKTQTAEPQPTSGITATLEYDSADDEDEPAPDARIQQLRNIRWQLEEMSRNAGGDKREVQLTYALDGAAAVLKKEVVI